LICPAKNQCFVKLSSQQAAGMGGKMSMKFFGQSLMCISAFMTNFVEPKAQGWFLQLR